MQTEQLLQDAVKTAFQQLYAKDLADVTLQATRKEFEGDLTVVTFPLGRLSGKSPEQTAHDLGGWLAGNSPMVTRYNVVKGFLNLVISDEVWLQLLRQQLRDEPLAHLQQPGQKVMVEYSSPNTNKPLHLGHLRNIFLGYAVANILKAAKYDVQMTNLVNDRGIHICKSMLAYQKYGQGETPESSGMKGDKLVGHYYVVFEKELKAQAAQLVAEGVEEEEARNKAPLMQEARAMLQAWEQGDEQVVELWRTMNGWVYDGFFASYKRMGVHFDKFYYESNTYKLGKDMVEEGLASGVFYRKDDGSVWIDLTEEGLDHKLVLRSDGTSVYITQDMGTADLKFSEFAMDKSLYVVGNEQDYHFAVLFHILRKLGRPYAQGLYHLSYGMVDLPSGKMKSREGTVVDADDIMDEMTATAKARTYDLGKIEGLDEAERNRLYEMLGIGAIKYFLLKVEPKKRMLFNPEESIELQGNTATAIQYSHARICSILRKAADLGVDAMQLPANYTLHPLEKELAIMLANYGAKVQAAALEYAPSLICNYVYDLSRAFNSLFAELSILSPYLPGTQDIDADTRQFRVALAGMVARTIKHAMGLLGIEVPERM